MGSHRVGHDWSDLAAEAAAADTYIEKLILFLSKQQVFDKDYGFELASKFHQGAL